MYLKSLFFLIIFYLLFNMKLPTGMIQMQNKHTAKNLKDEILKCLKEYNIKISQIYSTTTDNGANILKASKLLQELQEERINDEIHQCEDYSAQDGNIHSTLASVFSVVRCAAHTIQLASYDVINTMQHSINESRSIATKKSGFWLEEETVILICLCLTTQLVGIQHLKC